LRLERSTFCVFHCSSRTHFREGQSQLRPRAHTTVWTRHNNGVLRVKLFRGRRRPLVEHREAPLAQPRPLSGRPTCYRTRSIKTLVQSHLLNEILVRRSLINSPAPLGHLCYIGVVAGMPDTRRRRAMYVLSRWATPVIESDLKRGRSTCSNERTGSPGGSRRRVSLALCLPHVARESEASP
jgi:hypothetical protein